MEYVAAWRKVLWNEDGTATVRDGNLVVDGFYTVYDESDPVRRCLECQHADCDGTEFEMPEDLEVEFI